MQSRRRAPLPWLQRATADLRRIRSADAMLAFLAEYDCGPVAPNRPSVARLVLEHGQHLDLRVLSVLAEALGGFADIAASPNLSLATAEWVATRLVASIGTAHHYTAARIYAERQRALEAIIVRYGLNGDSLPAHVLFHEANVDGLKRQTAFARDALQRLLLFPGIAQSWLCCLRSTWQDDRAVLEALSRYSARAVRGSA